MNVFVDANVILDVLDQRELFLAESSNVLSLGAEHKITLYATAMTFATCIYILRKPMGYNNAVACINVLKEYINISIKDMNARYKGMWTYVYRGYRRTTKAVGNVHPKGVPLPWHKQPTPVERSFHSRQPLGSLQRQPRRSYKRIPTLL